MRLAVASLAVGAVTLLMHRHVAAPCNYTAPDPDVLGQLIPTQT